MDNETKTLNLVMKKLGALTVEERVRVLKYVVDKFAEAKGG